VNIADTAKAALAMGPSSSDANADEEDYSPAKASMKAFMDAVKSGDVDAALDAYADVKANCGMSKSGGAEE
jgi:iron uptake system EfeUOB component EfeO/EfeM